MDRRLFRRSALAAAFLTTTLAASVSHAAHSQRTVSIGRSWDLGAINSSALVGFPAASDHGPIVGMGIAGPNDHVYVWYGDGEVSSGTSQNFQYHLGKQSYVLPEGKNRWDIVAMAIAGSNNHVYTWYADGTVSEGWSRDLGAYSDPQPFTLPPGKVVSDIVGIGIAGSNDHVFAWYSDGTVSEGWTQDLAFHAAPYGYVVPAGKKIGHILDIAIAGSNDHVHAWFHDVEAGSGHSTVADRVDAATMDVLRRYQLPALGVSISKNGRVVLEKGYGFRNQSTGSRMQPYSRCRIGSVSKVITSLSAMHLDQTRRDFSVTQPLYGPGGALSAGIYQSAYTQGVTRYQPVVAKAIAADDHVYTWYHDGTASSGTSVDPDLYSGPYNYSLAPGMTPDDVRAIAIAPGNTVWVWYDDGTYSAGRSWDLDQTVPRDASNDVSIPDHNIGNVVGVDFSSGGDVYVWYDDGTTSAGTTSDFGANIAPRSYTTAPFKTPYFIRGIGIAKSNSHVYTFYNDNTVTAGWSRNLDSYGGPWVYAVPAYAFDPAKDWFDWYADMNVDHLMSHSSGLSRSGDTAGTETMFSTTEDFLGYQQVHEYVLRTRKLLFAPGTSKSYSNHGAGTIAHIVAEVSGMSFKSYVRNNIIDPLGLDIRAHSEGQQGLDTYRHEYIDNVPSAYVDDSTNDLGLGAGGWKSSAGDLVRLMLATDQNPNHRDILTATTLNTMESRPYPGASTFAHGWDRDNAGKLAHNGRLGGGTTYIAKYPTNYFNGNSQQINVAVCTPISISDARGGSGSLYQLADDIARVVNAASISSSYDLH